VSIPRRHRYIPALTAVGQREIGQEKLLSGQLIKGFIHGHLSCRFAGLGGGAQALPAGRAVRAGGLLAGAAAPQPAVKRPVQA
jgi:hypothetical protein